MDLVEQKGTPPINNEAAMDLKLQEGHPPINSGSEYLYLWVTHGANVSPEKNYYDIKSRFKKVYMYAKPHSYITLDELQAMRWGDSENKRYELKKVPEGQPNAGNFYIPPLLYYLGPTEAEIRTRHAAEKKAADELHEELSLHPRARRRRAVSRAKNKLPDRTARAAAAYSEEGLETFNAIGLWVIDSTNRWIWKIKGYNELAEDPNKLFNGPYTFSIINTYVTKYIEQQMVGQPRSEMSRVISNSSLGVFSCQRALPEYAREYAQPMDVDTEPLQELHARYIGPPANARFNEGNEIFSTSKVSSPTIIPLLTNPAPRWTALAGQKRSGCGLNVLGLFGILDQKVARERVVCLPREGSSIYSLYDFYAAHFSIMFKMYTRAEAEKGDKGHTVSFYKFDKKTYYGDPQIGNSTPVEGVETCCADAYINRIAKDINDLYGDPSYAFSVADMCWTIRPTSKGFAVGRPSLSTSELTEMLETNNFKIMPRPDTLDHGGTHRKSKRKSRKRSNGKKKSEKRRNTKNRNKAKNKKRSKSKISTRRKH